MGWIRLHRSIRDNELWDEKPFSYGQAWIDMLLRATYEEKNCAFKRHIKIELKRGQFLASSRELASDWGWSKDKVHRFFEHLKSETMIETLENKISTVVSIINYERYQQRDPVNEPLTSHSRATHEPLYYKEERNKERQEAKNGSLSEKSREPEAEPAPVRAKAKLVI